MRGTQFVLVVLAALPVLGGCATAGSLGGKDGCKVYGGTRLDATIISENLSGDADVNKSHKTDVAKSEKIEQPVMVLAACYGFVDMPLSFLADTMLLPITLPIAARKHGSEAQTAEQTSPEDDSATRSTE